MTVSGRAQRHAGQSSIGAGLGEVEDWLSNVAYGMEPEDGLVWIFGFADHGIMAFTGYGSENLVELIGIHKESLNSSSGEIDGATVRPR